ncbi:hypothetical protein M9Y10_036282 [Tritrichomonas musculus]|uniref:Nucleoplasmin-like domain-containing protein n=1 Tax=Tritrichomonas musculus TaxID=1915356 RepID=A0ABR2GW02_9EUKA
MSFDSDSSSSDMEYWENELVYLRPKQVWYQPFYKTCYLTNISFTVKPEKAEYAHAILQCYIDDNPVTLCSLYPNKPSQKMNIVWAPDQKIRLVNIGNHPVTLNILVRKLSP